METNIALLILGLVLGSVLSGLSVYIIFSRKASLLESRAVSAEAVKNELRQQIDQQTQKLDQTQNEFQNEAQLRAAMEARLHESEKNLQSMEKDLVDKFSTISLDALSKNSAEFLKLAAEKLKSQTAEGSKDLEGKKELIDKSLLEMDKTLSDVRKRIEDVSKGNVEVSTLIKKHEDVTTKLNDTTQHLKQALASSKKRGEWGERMAEDISI